MGRVKKNPVKIEPGLVGSDHPSRYAAAENLSNSADVAEIDKSSLCWAQEAPSYRLSVMRGSLDSSPPPRVGYPQTSTPKLTESKDPSRPTSEHSSSSMSEQSFRSDVEEAKLVIAADKSEPSWIAGEMKKPLSGLSSNEVRNSSQKPSEWISPQLSTSPINASFLERNRSTATNNNNSETERSYSFNHCQLNATESMDTLEIKDETESSIDCGKTVRPMKLMRCKQCDSEHAGKENLWQHLREVHPKENHLLCDYCPFATRYRHHYEYHIRNHRGEKPFKCEQCGYRCVNKSMLASHMKSHTTVYEYKCDTCSYETKYFHSLKQHLEKTNHFATPDKTGIPKKLIGDPSFESCNDLSPNGNTMVSLPSAPPLMNGISLLPPPPPLHNPFSQAQGQGAAKTVTTSGQMLDHPIPPPIFLSSPASKSNNFPFMNHPAIVNSLNPAMAMQLQNTMSLLYSEGRKLAGMDQAQALLQDGLLSSHLPDVPSDFSTTQSSKRKMVKSEAVDKDDIPHAKVPKTEPLALNSPEESTDVPTSKSDKNSSVKLASPSLGYDANLSISDLHYCKYCQIFFVDPIAYQVHEGNHNFDDPFKCNRCGHRANDAINFMSHGLCSK